MSCDQFNKKRMEVKPFRVGGGGHRNTVELRWVERKMTDYSNY